jgi:hypothetical protein
MFAIDLSQPAIYIYIYITTELVFKFADSFSRPLSGIDVMSVVTSGYIIFAADNILCGVNTTCRREDQTFIT